MKGIRGLCQKTVFVDIALVGTLFYLVYLFLAGDRIFKGAYKSVSYSSSLDLEEVEGNSFNSIDKSTLEYQIQLKTLQDFRSPKCKEQTDSGTDEKVTLVTYFYDYQLYDLKASLTTALEGDKLIREILVFNDGSTEKQLISEAKAYFKQLKIPVRLFHNEVKKGTAKILKAGITEARYDVIVFMDTTVICNRGWLSPLLEQLARTPNSIAVPHFDKITNLFPLQYQPIEETYAAVLQWNLHTVLKRVKGNNINTNNITSPSLRPDMLAFKKSYLQTVGDVDENFQLGGGESAELAIRVWSCGGSIQIVSCSRVGLVNFDRPFKITSGFNIRHLSGMWFQDKYPTLYRNMRPSDVHYKLISERKSSVMEPKKCTDVQWYFEKIQKKNIDIDNKMVKMGYLKVESGSCIAVADDMKIDVVNCDPSIEIETNPSNIFQLTSDQKLISNGKCLTATSTAYIVVEDCRPNDRQQSWEFGSDLKLINQATKACATHVTDPNPIIPQRQIAMVQSCPSDKEDYERFKKWTFLPV